MRHAEVSYVGERDPESVRLTPRGHEQAAAAQQALDGVDFDLVVTSSLPRTVETAEVVAPDHEPVRVAALDEWRSGQLSEIPAGDLEQAFVGALRVTDESTRFLAGESLGEVLDRIHPALEHLVARDWQTCLAVLHGAVNRIVLSYALTGGTRMYLGTFEQAPACVNVLDLADDGWIVRTVNYIPYDPLHPARTTTMEEYWVQLQAWRDSSR